LKCFSGCLKKLVYDFVEITDTLTNIRDGVFPVVFILDGDKALKVLSLQFSKHRFHIAYASFPNHVVNFRIVHFDVFKMETFNPTFVFFQGFNRVTGKKKVFRKSYLRKIFFN